MLSQGAISIGTNGLAGSISLATSGLREIRVAPIERADRTKKNSLDEKKYDAQWRCHRSNRRASRESPESNGDSRPLFRPQVSL
jgi:hypothetical protein